MRRTSSNCFKIELALDRSQGDQGLHRDLRFDELLRAEHYQTPVDHILVTSIWFLMIAVVVAIIAFGLTNYHGEHHKELFSHKQA